MLKTKQRKSFQLKVAINFEINQIIIYYFDKSCPYLGDTALDLARDSDIAFLLIKHGAIHNQLRAGNLTSNVVNILYDLFS